MATEQAPLILAIDDSETLRSILTGYLESLGYRVATAEQGVAGYTMARDLQPALILLDITMPGLDGFQIAEMLRTDPLTHAIPLVFLTGHAQKEDELRGMQLGADDYITKPFDIEVLREHIAAVLRRTQPHKEAS